jgi:D-amino peptidase
MKIFIAVDMEGATGVVHPDQLMPEGRGYAAAQRMLTADVNAVISGILDEDAEADIVVGEGHAIMRNVILDDMPPQARVVIGPARPDNKSLCQLEGLDASFDALFQVGYHAMAGCPGGLLAHTYVGSLVNTFWLNGRPAGEVEVNAAIAGSMGVPVGLVVANSDVAGEMGCAPKATFVATKQVLGPTAAMCLPPSATAVLLRNAAANAMRSLSGAALTPYVPQCPLTMSVTMHRREQAARAMLAGGVTLTNDRTIEAQGDNAADVFRTIWRALCMALSEHPTWLQ